MINRVGADNSCRNSRISGRAVARSLSRTASVTNHANDLLPVDSYRDYWEAA